MIVEVLRDRNLRLYFTGGFISSLGNQFSFFAQSVAAYLFTGHLASVGLLWLLRGISSLLFIPVGGAVADRHDRKKIVLVTHFISGLLAFCYVLIDTTNAIWLLPTLAFFSQAVNRFLSPAENAAFKRVSKNVPLEKSNALDASLGQISIILGPLLATFAFYLTSGNIHALFIADGVSFFFSFVLMIFVFFGDYYREMRQKDSFYTDIIKGFRHISDRPFLLYLLLLMVPIGLSGKVFDVLVLELSDSKLSLSSVGGIGIYLAVFALGGIVAMTQVQKWKKHFESLSLYGALALISGVLFILLGLFSRLATTLIVTFFLGCLLNISMVAAQVNIQKTGEDAFLGRIFAAWRFFAVLGGSAGAFLSGILSDAIGPHIVFMLTGCLLILPWPFSVFVRKKEA